MRSTVKALGSAALLLALACAAQAKSWRGITPLHSTRADVVRLLGQCSEPNGGCRFKTTEADVFISFSSKDGYAYDCVKKLPPGVVLLIEITPKKDVRLADLYAEPGKLKKVEGYTVPDPAYVDEEEGAVYRTSDGKVELMVYTAARKDRPLCPGYYDDAARLVVNFVADPPVLDMVCPETVEAGEWVTLMANLTGADPAGTPTFSWELTAGKILTGQGTPSIKVDSVMLLEGRRIKATVKVGEPGEYSKGWQLEASCLIRVVKKGKGDK